MSIDGFALRHRWRQFHRGESAASVDDAETLIDIDGNWLVILCCKNADAGADGRMKLLFDTALASIPAGQLLIKISSTVHLDEFGHSEK